MFGHVHVADQIYCDHPLGIGHNDVFDANVGRRRLDGGVVDQHIQPAKTFYCPRDRALAVWFARYIEGVKMALSGQLRRRRCVDITTYDGSARLGEALANGESDSIRASRYQYDSARVIVANAAKRSTHRRIRSMGAGMRHGGEALGGDARGGVAAIAYRAKP
jgi:hypothetical protein